MYKFKIGDYVTVTHSVREWGASRGFEVKLWDYGDTWVPDMDGAIGKQFTIIRIDVGGYRLCYESYGRTFRFPEACLQSAERKAAERPEVTIWQ